MDTFNTKLDVGVQGGEVLTYYYLTKILNKQVVRASGFDRTKDFIVSGKPVELKTDVLAWKTGNVCIEHWSLKNHTAPIVLTLIPTFYWSTRDDLKELVSWYPNVTTGGDDKRPQTLLELDSPSFAKIFKKL